MSTIPRGEINGFVLSISYQRLTLLLSSKSKWFSVTYCLLQRWYACVHQQDLPLSKRKSISILIYCETLIFSTGSPTGKFLFFPCVPDTGEAWSSDAGRGLRPGFSPLAACLLGPGLCVAAVYTCWSAFCVWVGTASFHARAPSCSWGLSQSFETYELAVRARECLSQFLGELHVFSRRLDHCPQTSLARQNVTVTVWDILNF